MGIGFISGSYLSRLYNLFDIIISQSKKGKITFLDRQFFGLGLI
jgi:hypothetical protein